MGSKDGQPAKDSGPLLSTVTSLVGRRVKGQGAMSEVVQTACGKLGDFVFPQGDGSGADVQCPGELCLRAEMRNRDFFEHEAKLSIPSLKTQTCLADGSLSLLYMKNQLWKNCRTFAERIQWAIDSEGITQADLAKHLKISTAGMSEWFTGITKNPKLINARRAAQFCKVNSWWLAIGEGSPYDGIDAQYDGINGQDLLIAKGLSDLGDNELRGTVQELIAARKMNQYEKSQKKRKA